MKIQLKNADKVSIIRGLKKNEYYLSELNHLSKHIQDHRANIELFGDISLSITMNDKRNLLKAMRNGYIDFDLMPDLTEKIKQNLFLEVMKASSTITNQ